MNVCGVRVEMFVSGVQVDRGEVEDVMSKSRGQQTEGAISLVGNDGRSDHSLEAQNHLAHCG